MLVHSGWLLEATLKPRAQESADDGYLDIGQFVFLFNQVADMMAKDAWQQRVMLSTWPCAVCRVQCFSSGHAHTPTTKKSSQGDRHEKGFSGAAWLLMCFRVLNGWP